jgi:spore germination protein YaaH
VKKVKTINVLVIAICLLIITFFLSLEYSKSKNSVILSPFADTFSIFSLLNNQPRPKYTVYGFLPYWNLDKAEFLQLNKITDLAYFGLNITADGTFKKFTDTGETDPGYNNWKNNENLNDLIKKAKKNGTNVALTIISHDDAISDQFLNCPQCWETLSTSIIAELNSKELKDVNLNFEYSTYTEQETADKYTQLTAFINRKLDEKYGDSKVVVSTFADSNIKPRVTDINDLSKVADALFIMGYDFHRPDSDQAGPVAPIGGAGVHAEYDLQTMIKDYLSAAPASKLIMGVPYYGYNWVVDSTNAYADRIPGNDSIGFSQSQTYEDVMETIRRVNPIIAWDDLGKVPYFTYISPETGSTRQVYYENTESLKEKYRLVKSNGFSGVGIWALGYDGGYQELWQLLEEEFIL